MVPTDMKTQLKRRISFSGKNSVRVFHGEEEPKTWNNSYEISDHLNANETASNLCVLPKPTTLKSALKNKENKENVDQSYEIQKTIEQNQKYKNLSVSNNVSVLSTTKDLINISYQHQTSKMYQIENSVDITLYEKELKFQVAEDKSSDQTKCKLYSFSLEDNEKETRSVMFGEKTIDFMRSLQGDALNIVEDNRNPCDVTDKGVTVFSEYMDEEQYIEVMNVKDKIQKEPITIYMNDSLSISDQEQISENKRKTLHDAPMQLSPNKAKQYNKENVIPPLPMENANETQNYSCQMEIEDDIFSEPQSNKVNVEKESVAFQEKLNRISFLQTSDDNMEIDRSPKVGNDESDVKSRQTINFNEAIEMSPKTSNFNYNKNKPHSRPTINFNQAIVISPNRDKTSSVSTQMKSSRSTINFNQPIDMSPSRENKTPAAPVQNKSSRSTINFNQPIDMSPSRENKTSGAPIQNKSSRSTINFNQPIDMSPNRDNKTSAVPVQNKSSRTTINFNKSIDFSPKNSENKNCLGTIKSRPTINFNQSMEIDSQNTAAGNPVQHGAIPKNKSRTTINFNQPIETSPLRTKNNLQRQTLLLKEDICESPKLSQEPARSNNLNVPDSVRKHGQVPKLIVRKICTPLVNKNKNLTDLDQQRMLRYKKKQEQMDPDKDKEIPTAIEERKKPTKADKSLNFSLSSVKNVSLSPESSSPLIPSEFKAYNLKQLNDEIERGKINVFSNAPKTPSTDRKLRFGAQSSQPTLMKQRRTLVFDDVDIPISSDDTFKTTKSNNYFDFNTTQEAQQNKKTNTKCRFSQADDIMLDNTSFLTRAKLGDETVSRNSSKREFTQLNDIMDVFNESLREAASKLGSSVKSKKSCTSKNDTLSSMFQNAKPIFTQTITTLKDMNLYDAMDISHDIESNGDKYEKDINNQNYHMRQTVLLDHDIDPCDNINENTKKNLNSQIDKNINNINFENNEMEIDNDQEHNIETHQKVSEKNTRQTIYLNSDIGEPHHLNDERIRDKTLYLDEVVNDDINHRTQANNKEATSNVASMCGRQTTYLNNDIEESLNSDALEKSNKKTDDLKENLVSDGEHNKESHGKESKQLCDDYNLSINIVDNGINDEQLHKRQQLQTLVYHQDIDHDMSIENQSKVTGKTSTEIKENTQYGRNICEDVSKNITRKTLFLDEETPFENLLTEKEKNEDTENPPSSISNRNSTRKTLYFNSEIPLEKSQIINEEYNSIEKNDRDIPKFSATRQTTFFNNEIPLDDVEKNIQSVKAGVEIENCKQTRKTLYFNKEIVVENITEKIDGSIQNDNDNYKETRKTLYFNNEIDEEKAATRNKNDFQTDIQSHNITRQTLYYNNDIPEDINVQNSNLTRNTIQLNSDIPVEKVPAIIGSANQKDEINKSLENVNPYRKTEFYGNEICEFDESKCDNISKNLPKQVPQARKSVYIAQEMDVTLNETTTGIVENMNVSNNQQYDENKVESSTINVPKSRKSIYTTECMDLTLNVKEVEKEEEGIPHICQSKEIENDSMMNLSIPDENSMKNEEVPKECKELSNCEDNKSSKETRKTLYFEHNNEMSLDQSFTPAENYEFPEPGEPLNAAKMTLSRHVSTNALSNKSKLPKKDENTFMTPLKFPGTNSNNYMTPRLSLLEFKAAERKILEEERLERNKYLSPIRNDNTNKRLPINITPVLSNPKKRHTLVFDDCLMDESNISLQADNDLKKDISCNEKPDLTEESKKQEPFRLSKGVTNDHAMEISGIVANDSVLQTPTKQRKSRIPIPISSGKKSNRSFSVLHTSDIHPKEDNDQVNTETEDQLNMEPDNLAESIQVMRRATTFLQRRDTEIGHKELDLNTETDPIKKSSIFEGNPITISDVSVFFEAQRKSNSVGPETEMTLALDKMNASGLNAIEKAKKSLENRYLNLTLEDIEKTRLSLVRISYEDGTINNTNASVQEQIDDCVANQDVPDDKNISNNDLEDKIELKNRRHSVNYLRNVSTVCRKCKRCQDTFLNETSSSASESFVLPPLPPLPDLGLERLRRLRKRPAIADVNILWQRVSLDRTIINALNISDDDSQIISDLDDEADDESSTVIQCIRKYEKDMLSFEMELLGKHPSKTSSIELPFVLRLDNLLSEKSTNWIFDFQMQSRGILLFTHKQMYTFAVSLTFNEIDPLGRDISLKSVSLEKGFVPEKNWKAIDFVLDFQFKLNLPFDLQSLCEGSNEAGIFKMLQTIDRVCLDTIKMGKQLQRICFTNQAAIIRDEFRTYARKIIRNIRNRTNSDFKCVEKTEIKVELLNIKKLSFRNIVSPPLHHFCEEIHLVPTGLQFLNEFLQKPINYIKHH